MRPFCSTEQYQARYGSVPDEAQLEECLGDASRLIASTVAEHGMEPGDFDPDVLMQCCRQMANRVLPVDQKAAIPTGASSASRTVGPYTYQFGFSTPYGSPRVTRAELDLLGLGGAPAGFVALIGD